MPDAIDQYILAPAIPLCPLTLLVRPDGGKLLQVSARRRKENRSPVVPSVGLPHLRKRGLPGIGLGAVARRCSPDLRRVDGIETCVHARELALRALVEVLG